jgi:hypothetical protein
MVAAPFMDSLQHMHKACAYLVAKHETKKYLTANFALRTRCRDLLSDLLKTKN